MNGWCGRLSHFLRLSIPALPVPKHPFGIQTANYLITLVIFSRFLRSCKTASGLKGLVRSRAASLAWSAGARHAIGMGMDDQASSKPSGRGPVMVPAPTRADNQTAPMDRAIRALVPSGERREILALFDNRASWSAIRHWRAGRWGPPAWAVDCLQQRVAPVMELKPVAARGVMLMAWLRAHGRLPAKEKPGA